MADAEHLTRIIWRPALAVLVLGAIVGTYLLVRPRPAANAGVVVGYSAPPSVPTLRVVILRGGATGCRPTGGCSNANYAQVLSAKEGWTTTVLAQGGTGYVSGSQNSPPTNFATQLPAIYKARPDLVIVEGSVGDQYFPGPSVGQAAVELFTELKSHLPNAKVVAVGPAWAGQPPANVAAVENAVDSAAVGRVTLAIDPIAEGWFSGANASLMAPDLQSPTDKGHAQMATMIAADLQRLHLGSVASSPSQ